MVPYWDWTMPQYRTARPEDRAAIIPQAFQAFLTRGRSGGRWSTALDPRPSRHSRRRSARSWTPRSYFDVAARVLLPRDHDDRLHRRHARPKNANRQAMIDALMTSNSLWYPLRYPAEYEKREAPSTEAIHYHYPTAEDIDADPRASTTFGTSAAAMSTTPRSASSTRTRTTRCTSGPAGRTRNSRHPIRPARLCLRQAARSRVRRAGRRCASDATSPSRSRTASSTRETTSTRSPPSATCSRNLTAVLRSDLLAGARQCRSDSGGNGRQHNPNGVPVRPRFRAVALELHDPRHARHLPVRLRIRALLVFHAGRHGSADRPLRLGADQDRSERPQRFKKAEIRMHWVPQLERSCFVRAFLQRSRAPTRRRRYGTIRTMRAISPSSAMANATAAPAIATCRRRARGRSTSARAATTHRATIASTSPPRARRMLKTGDELQITLLVIGVDYREDSDLLRLEGVSLNLLD